MRDAFCGREKRLANRIGEGVHRSVGFGTHEPGTAGFAFVLAYRCLSDDRRYALYDATDCRFPALPGLRARPIRRRLRNCRVEAMALSREREFYRSVGVRNHGANRAVKIRHRMLHLGYALTEVA